MKVCELAQSDGIRVRGYVSCVIECPYDGPIHPTVSFKAHRETRANLLETCSGVVCHLQSSVIDTTIQLHCDVLRSWLE